MCRTSAGRGSLMPPGHHAVPGGNSAVRSRGTPGAPIPRGFLRQQKAGGPFTGTSGLLAPRSLLGVVRFVLAVLERLERDDVVAVVRARHVTGQLDGLGQ